MSDKEEKKKAGTNESELMRTTKLLTAGGLAGAIARTATAPLDRMKLLFQTNKLPGMTTAQGFIHIFKQQGLLSFWAGNAALVIRIFPYSAIQMGTYDIYKQLILRADQTDLTVEQRLVAGALAGMTGTFFTHPLDCLRLRLAVHPELKTMTAAAKHMFAQGGFSAFWSGLGPTMVGIAPYVGLNFASYDVIKRFFYPDTKPSIIGTLLIGAASGNIAQTICYPLDTVRRRQQLGDGKYKSALNAWAMIIKEEGVIGLFRGYVANTIKVIPNNAIRFLAYSQLKTLFNITGKSTDT